MSESIKYRQENSIELFAQKIMMTEMFTLSSKFKSHTESKEVVSKNIDDHSCAASTDVHENLHAASNLNEDVVSTAGCGDKHVLSEQKTFPGFQDSRKPKSNITSSNGMVTEGAHVDDKQETVVREQKCSKLKFDSGPVKDFENTSSRSQLYSKAQMLMRENLKCMQELSARNQAVLEIIATYEEILQSEDLSRRLQALETENCHLLQENERFKKESLYLRSMIRPRILHCASDTASSSAGCHVCVQDRSEGVSHRFSICI